MYNTVWSSSYTSIQSDWAPPIVPALWGRVQGSECQRQEPCNPPPEKGTSILLSYLLIDLIVTPFQGGHYGGQGAQQPHDSYQRPDQYAEAPQEEHKKNWLGEHKKELEVRIGLFISNFCQPTHCPSDRRRDFGRCCRSRRRLLRV